MRNYLIKSFLTLACLALVLVPVPVRAQSSGIGLSIYVSPSTINRGGTVGVFALVTNSSTSRLRTTVTFTAVSACGTQISLGYHKVVLDPGMSMQVTTTYMLPPDACPGTYTISINASGGGKNTATASTSCYLTVL
jgi:hypothetical protein